MAFLDAFGSPRPLMAPVRFFLFFSLGLKVSFSLDLLCATAVRVDGQGGEKLLLWHFPLEFFSGCETSPLSPISLPYGPFFSMSGDQGLEKFFASLSITQSFFGVG